MRMIFFDVIFFFLCIILSIFFYCVLLNLYISLEGGYGVFFVVSFFWIYIGCFFCQICLILAEATAIGVRLSHASRTNLYSWHTAQ